MLIVNADDWGGWKEATDAAVAGIERGTITSVSAMVFSHDSERAASIASDLNLDTGLHLNLDGPIDTKAPCYAQQDRVRRFLRKSKFAQLLYNPVLRGAFRDTFRCQWDEFVRLYRRTPSHIDGHHHMHLCLNVLFGGLIPQGSRVRRSFSFAPRQKALLNRAYRSSVTFQLRRSYRTTDHFFSLEQVLQRSDFARVARVAKESSVELMTHPESKLESEFLLSEDFGRFFAGVTLASYATL